MFSYFIDHPPKIPKKNTFLLQKKSNDYLRKHKYALQRVKCILFVFYGADPSDQLTFCPLLIRRFSKKRRSTPGQGSGTRVLIVKETTPLT